MTDAIDTEPTIAAESDSAKSSVNFDVFATGVATGLVATVIVETGKSAVGILAKNPLVVLSSGVITGYFAHKYRKEIIISSTKVAAQSKDFVARQQKNFSKLLAED